MDEQPARIDMRSPEGTVHVVLVRDRETFEAQGFEYQAPHAGGPQSPGAAPSIETIAAAGDDGESAEVPAPAPAVDAEALVKPDHKPARAPRKPKPA